MDLDLPPKLKKALASNFELLWQMLSVDAGCSVSIIDRNGYVRWANERTLIDYEWHLSIRNPDATGEELDPIDKPLHQILRPEFVVERIAYIEESLETGRTVVYESVLRGVRQRVAIRPIGGAGGDLVAMIARRLRGTERIKDHVPPGAVLRAPKVQDPGLLGVLSARELDVLKLVGDGLNSGEIARRLHRSVRTIEGHRKAIGEKLGFSRATDVVRVAIRAGLCELPDSPDNPASG
jgi:DNA-binding CsgD family transcriptional regulator